MSLFGEVRKYWAFEGLVISLALFTFLDIGSVPIPREVLGILVIIFGVFSFIDKKQTERSRKDDKEELRKLRKLFVEKSEDSEARSEVQNQAISELKGQLDDHDADFQIWRDRKETSIQLMNELIQNGVINETDAYKNFESRHLFIIYCFARPLPKIWGSKALNRQYPNFFIDELHCFRIQRGSQIFLTNGRRLPVRLRNTSNLQKFCISRLDPFLEKEWKLFLKELQDNKHRDYKKYKDEPYQKYLSLSLSVFKCSINDKNIGKIRELYFPKEYNDLLNEEVDLDKVGLPQEKKAAVKKFITSSSILLLFNGWEKSKVEKIGKIEDDLKEKFEIASIFDYLKRDKSKLKLFLSSNGFSQTEAAEYVDRIFVKLPQFRDSLKELNIII